MLKADRQNWKPLFMVHYAYPILDNVLVVKHGAVVVPIEDNVLKLVDFRTVSLSMASCAICKT